MGVEKDLLNWRLDVDFDFDGSLERESTSKL